MKLKQVAPSLLESSNLPPGVDERTGLSRTDVEANIEMILEDIHEIIGALAPAIEQCAAESGDRWGTQGSLQEIKSKLMDAYQYTTGKPYYGQ